MGSQPKSVNYWTILSSGEWRERFGAFVWGIHIPHIFPIQWGAVWCYLEFPNYIIGSLNAWHCIFGRTKLSFNFQARSWVPFMVKTWWKHNDFDWYFARAKVDFKKSNIYNKAMGWYTHKLYQLLILPYSAIKHKMLILEVCHGNAMEKLRPSPPWVHHESTMSSPWT